MNTKFLSKRFFDKNYKIILKGSCSALRVNELLVTFFGKKIAKTVKYKDVALGLVKYLFEKGIVVDQKKLNSLCNNSNFLEKYVKIPLEKIVEKTLKANPISEEEIKAIDSRKGLEYIKESNRKEIADDISELKKEKEELLKSLPSILDNESFEEPKQDADIYKNREVWWQKLNLISDPFPTQNGLSKIDKKMYDDVVIKTDSFKRIVNLFKQDPKNFFNKGTLLSGGFGTGKTTAIDYLGYFIKENYNYASLTITFDQQRDVIDYIQRFKFELLKELKKISNQFDIELNNLSPDLECDIPWLMMELSDHDIDGIIVFIDDLHKHTNRDLVFDFLSQMQIVKNNLIKENLNVGFIVSGTKQWEKSLLKDTRLTGFFDNASIEIENPTPETIFEVISKRLNAFLYNKDKKLVIDMEYIRRIYDKAKTEGFKNGYRGFINEVVNELRSGITNLFEIDPIILEKDKKEKIREMIESNSIVYKKINSFLHGNSEFKNESKKRGVRILSSIYLKNGVLEEDDYFRKNVFSFRLLNDAQLIQRSRTSDGKLKWVVDQNLLELNKGIKQIYGCSLEDYLENIFFEVVSNDKNKQYSLDDEKVKQIDLFLKTIKGNMNSLAYEQFKSSFEIYKDVLVNFSLKKIKESEYVNFIDRCNNSLRLLSSTIFLIEDISSELKLKKFTEAWVYHWNGIPEVLSEFVSEIENIDKIKEEKL
ncbi:MAG: hypothetical protein WCX20_02400, partial [Candidatus Shapirobacteria bacterium]